MGYGTKLLLILVTSGIIFTLPPSPTIFEKATFHPKAISWNFLSHRERDPAWPNFSLEFSKLEAEKTSLSSQMPNGRLTSDLQMYLSAISQHLKGQEKGMTQERAESLDTGLGPVLRRATDETIHVLHTFSP